MVFSHKVFTSVLLAVLFASSSFAAPWPSTSKHATHRVRDISSDLKLETFHPASTFEVRARLLVSFRQQFDGDSLQTFGDGIDHPLSKRADASLEDIATAFVKSHLSVDSSAVTFKSGYAGEVSSHAYFKQVHVRCRPIRLCCPI